MAAIHETAYPRIKPHLSHKELQEIFMPSPEAIRCTHFIAPKANLHVETQIFAVHVT